jgi:FixJ family two-component response regulator
MILARFSGPKGLTMTEIGQRRVAIVDDDLAVRESLRFLLEIIGHPVETFASAAEFLKAGQQHLACLILDHHIRHPDSPDYRLAVTGNSHAGSRAWHPGA